MKINKWTAGLAAVGLVSLASVAQAEETTPLLTALSSTVISGYVDVSAVWNPGTGNANPAPVAFNAGKQDGFNLNVVGLTLEKPLDESSWSAGYKVDLIFGPDAVGFNPSVNSTADVVDEDGDTIGTASSSSDFGVKQAYVALRAPVGNGLDLKLGVFDTIIGYESFTGYRNPNYTRSYGYTIEPTQHTGVLASYQLSDLFAVSAGVANTLTAGINTRSTRSESHKTYMGSVTFTAPEDMGFLAGSAIYAGVVDGFAGTSDDQTSWYVGGTFATPVAGLRLGAAYDMVYDLAGGAAGDGSDYADVIAGYISFQATEKLSLHTRGEYAKVNPLFGGHARVLALTGTAQYDLWQNVISRLEVRWDHSTSGGDLFGGSTAGRDNARSKDAVQVAANLIYVF